jgi:hypothetical protein
LRQKALKGVLEFLDNLLDVRTQVLKILACILRSGVRLRSRLLRACYQHQAEKTQAYKEDGFSHSLTSFIEVRR